MKYKKIFNSLFYIFIAAATVLFSFFFIYGFSGYFRCRTFINKYSSAYGLDKNEVAAIIKAESNFNPNAKSREGATGLMQIMPETADFIARLSGIDKYNLYDERTNIRFGCFYLRYLKNKFYSDGTVYAAYNAGEGKVREWLKNKDYSEDGENLSVIPYPETRNYVRKVSAYKRLFSLLF